MTGASDDMEQRIAAAMAAAGPGGDSGYSGSEYYDDEGTDYEGENGDPNFDEEEHIAATIIQCMVRDVVRAKNSHRSMF